MRKIELWFGKQDTAQRIFNILSIEFEIEPKINALEELEEYIRNNGDFQVEIRYADEPYGEAAVCLQQVFLLFENLKAELGEERFNYMFLPREEVTLDFSGCKHILDVYGEMRVKMEWDEDFGENLDALWDILWGMPYKGDDFTILRPRRYKNIPHGKDSWFTEYMDKVCSIFQRAEREGIITVKIQYTDGEAEDMSGYLL